MPGHALSNLMKNVPKKAYGKDIKSKILSIGNANLAKCKVSTHEAIKRVLTVLMRHSNINVLYIPASLKNNRSGMFRPLSILGKMHPDDTNVFAPNIIGKYEN